MVDRKITVYSQPFWGPCSALAEYLTGKGVSFVIKDLMIDEEARDELFTLGVRTAPALVVDSEVLTGFDKARIDTLLNLWSRSEFASIYPTLSPERTSHDQQTELLESVFGNASPWKACGNETIPTTTLITVSFRRKPESSESNPEDGYFGSMVIDALLDAGSSPAWQNIKFGVTGNCRCRAIC